MESEDILLYRADWCTDNALHSTYTFLPEIFHDIPQSLQAKGGTIPPSGHDVFLPNPFQFIAHLSPYNSTLNSLATDGVVKQLMKRGKRKLQIPQWTSPQYFVRCV
jgi:hypothetical protein